MSKGRGWSRALLGVGALASLAANIRHSYIPPKPDGASPERWREYAAAYTDYSPAPESVFWAGLVVVAAWMSLEAIVRIRWDGHRVLGLVIKALLTLSVFAVAVVASYNHQSSILEYAGAGRFEVMFGPLLPDGMMLLGLGGLIMDSLGREPVAEDRGPTLAQRVAALRSTALDTVAAAKGQAPIVHTDTLPDGRTVDIVDNQIVGLGRTVDVDIRTQDMDIPAVRTVDTDMEDTDAVDMDQLPLADQVLEMSRRMSNRTMSWDKDKAVPLLPTGTDKEIASEFGVSSKTIQRLRKDTVLSLLKDTVDTDDQISKATGMSVTSVARARKAWRAGAGLS